MKRQWIYWDTLLMPLTKLKERYVELDKNKSYVLYCAVGLRGYLAERILKQHGYKVRNMIGGYRTFNDLIFKGNQGVKMEQDKLEGTDKEESHSPSQVEVIEANLCGLSCPGPIMSVSKKMNEMKEGSHLRVKSTDPGFARDNKCWCENTGNELISKKDCKDIWEVELRRSSQVLPSQSIVSPKEKTMIIFDGDLYKALASFIIANGALAMGNSVNMFFTFWGLNILRKSQHVPVKKDFISKMFGMMMPKGPSKLGLSKMNFGGAGQL